MIILVPCDPLAPRRPDEHFLPEATAAREAGHTVVLVDHDLLVAGDVDAAVASIRGTVEAQDASALAVYRGWMVTSDTYAHLSDALSLRGVTLRTTPEQFRTAHELPGWYDALADHTPASAWTRGPDLDAFDACCARLAPGPGVLRDYTKSLKRFWSEAAYIGDLTDTVEARRIADRFLELRGSDFVGGLVVREFEHFTTTEARTWWVDGRCVLVTAHPDTPDVVPDMADVEFLTPAVAGLCLPFVTVDLVMRADGVWRVVELGDGQVSDRPTTTPAADLVAAVLSSHR